MWFWRLEELGKFDSSIRDWESEKVNFFKNDCEEKHGEGKVTTYAANGVGIFLCNL